MTKAVDYLADSFEKSGPPPYAVLDVLDSDGDIVQDFIIPHARAFRWWYRKLGLGRSATTIPTTSPRRGPSPPAPGCEHSPLGHPRRTRAPRRPGPGPAGRLPAAPPPRRCLVQTRRPVHRTHRRRPTLGGRSEVVFPPDPAAA
jgi:hypothetical protein